MPKMKSHSGAKKRFRVSKSGAVKHAQQGKNHIALSKNRKRKDSLRQGAYMASSKQEIAIRTLIQK